MLSAKIPISVTSMTFGKIIYLEVAPIFSITVYLFSLEVCTYIFQITDLQRKEKRHSNMIMLYAANYSITLKQENA